MIDLVITPKEHDIGGLVVRRVLPSHERRSVGPFVFFDQMGPATFPSGNGIDVRPHPHIGLETITYLYDGVIMHRDSLGYAQPIRPGEVNWMTAGRGIVHSERTPDDERANQSGLSGIQAWIALPIAHAETEPSFTHYPAGDLPEWEEDGFHLQLIAGTLMGRTSPVKIHSPMFYADVRAETDAILTLPPEFAERAVHVSEGVAEIAGEKLEAGQMAVLGPGDDIVIQTRGPARLMLLGGSPLDGPRTIWWNFVSHSKDRIELAKSDWKAGWFDKVPGDSEFIPLPD